MICGAIQNLIDYGIKNHLITDADEFVVRNDLMDALHLTDWKDSILTETSDTIDEILKPLVDYAVKQGIISDHELILNCFYLYRLMMFLSQVRV